MLRGKSAHRYLTARLAESFGRPVEVRRFDFSFLDGLRLSASRITVAEDPRFGQEYFLRAEQLTAGLRWRQLLSRRFEFGTLTFSRPSLNLVRTNDGRWNIESWMPVARPSPGRSSLSVPREPAGRLYKIKVDGGRINFKSGAHKRPFALIDVSGSMEQENPGRWRLDLEARPMRAGVMLQQSGILRVSGRIAGTSARLQPAELYAQWADASIADSLRLANGKDYGVRGRLTLELIAQSRSESVPGWKFALTARATHFHRWDLAGRMNDPAVNVKAEALWDPREPRLRIGVISAEGPHSELHGAGEVRWQSDIEPDLKLQTAGIDCADLFGWYRAFQADVSEQAAIGGFLQGRLEMRGWPVQLESAEFASLGVSLGVTGLREPVSSEKFSVRLRDGWLEIDPLVLHLPSASTAETTRAEIGETVSKKHAAIKRTKEDNVASRELLKLSARLSPREKAVIIAIQGETSRSEDLLLAMKAIGHPVNADWTLTGPANFNLHRDFRLSHATSTMAGWIELEDSRLRVVGLNLPLDVTDARIEWKESERKIALRSVSGFGAQWTGTITRRGPASDGTLHPWQFDLSADHVSAAELDRWLGPRARRGFLERLLPGLANSVAKNSTSNPGAGDDPVKSIRARGSVAIDDLEIAPVRVRKLKGRVEIDGRTVRMEDARGDFYGGSLTGSFAANLKALPEYRADAQVERVNLSMLAGATATLRDRFSGSASAGIHLAARGIGREDLARSVEGRGEFTALGTQVRGLDLKSAMGMKVSHGVTAQWPLTEGAFSIRSRVIRLSKLLLKDGATDFLGEGTVDFSHALDLDLRLLADSDFNGLATTRARAVHVTGTLEAPQFESVVSRVDARHASN